MQVLHAIVLSYRWGEYIVFRVIFAHFTLILPENRYKVGRVLA